MTWFSRRPRAAQLDELPAGVGQVERRAHRPGQPDGVPPSLRMRALRATTGRSRKIV